MVAKISRKYPQWGQFLKSHRSERYRSAREFCSREEVGISYPQYSRYEAGDQLPNLDQAIRLCRLLNIPLLTGILHWAQAQTSDPEAVNQVGQFLSQMEDGSLGFQVPEDSEAVTAAAPSATTLPLDDVFVFNRSHLSLFRQEPFYRDLFSLINTYGGEWVSVEELANTTSKPASEIDALLHQLYEHGVLSMQQDQNQLKVRVSKRNFYYPDDEEFFELRNQNLAHNINIIMDQLRFEDVKKGKAYRSVLTVQLSEKRRQELIESLDDLIERTLHMQERRPGNRLHSLCVLLGERFPNALNEEEARAQEIPKGLSVSLQKRPSPIEGEASFLN